MFIQSLADVKPLRPTRGASLLMHGLHDRVVSRRRHVDDRCEAVDAFKRLKSAHHAFGSVAANCDC
jgi:hypothetical protein